MSNWKAPRKDGIHSYWNLLEWIAVQTNKILMGDDSLPAWMTHGRTVLCQKDPRKGNAVENYCPVTCLPLMRELLNGVIAKEMHDYLEQEKLLPKEHKRCRQGNHGTKDQLLIDETVLRLCKKRQSKFNDLERPYESV